MTSLGTGPNEAVPTIRGMTAGKDRQLFKTYAMQTEQLQQDYRPLFKQIFGSGYFVRKASQLRISRQTLWYVLSGRKVDPSILDPCLEELNERIEFLNSSWKKAKELMETHKKLRG